MIFSFLSRPKEAECTICGVKSVLVSETLELCVDCIRNKFDEAHKHIMKAHEKIRLESGLPPFPPKSRGGIKCTYCSNKCVLGPGEISYCGLRVNVNGKLKENSSKDEALLYAYKDPLPTNCCSTYFCPGGTGAGYPIYSVKKGPEYGSYNLAIFFYGCNFNCIFCQNSSHKEVGIAPKMSKNQLVETIVKDERITCICFFGGSPEPQLPFALNFSQEVLEECRSRVLRVCWEWNGCGNPKLVRKAAELSLISGGNVKFDLKTYSKELSYGLSGVSNEQAYKNFQMIFDEFYEKRRDLPVLTATTLLVPGYVDEREVEGIARFISELDEEIPYSLLVFHPDYKMRDMPITPKKQVVKCYEEAKKHLKNVNIGNKHLLSLV